MDTPVGAEWNTRVGFQRGTLPRVTKKVWFYPFPDVLRDVLNIALDGHRHHTAGKAVLSSCIQLFAILHLPTTHPPPCHMLILTLNPLSNRSSCTQVCLHSNPSEPLPVCCREVSYPRHTGVES